MPNRARQYERARWYERENLPYAADWKLVEGYADWLKLVEWKLFCTFTFAGKVSDAHANRGFDEFIDGLERHVKCDVGYVRGDERRFSGCGKPASGRHFHALLTYEGKVHPPSLRGSGRALQATGVMMLALWSYFTTRAKMVQSTF